MYVHRWMLIALLLAAASCIGYDIREAAAQNGAPELPFAVPEYPEPEDNAWDYVLRATQVLDETNGKRGSEIVAAAWGTELEPDYAAAAECYQSALTVLRMGLYNECRIPDIVSFDQPLTELAGIREMARGLSYEARAYLAAGETDKAIDSLQDCLRLARNANINGVLIHALVGKAIEAIATHALSDCLNEGDPSADRLIAFAAWNEQNRLSRQSFADSLALDLRAGLLSLDDQLTLKAGFLKMAPSLIAWAEQPSHLRGDAPQTGTVGGGGLMPEPPHYQRLAWQIAESDATLAGMSIRCAMVAFKLRTGAYPGTLGDLSPDYLPELPKDPFSGEDFRYRVDAQAGTYLLYSVGPDRHDDGGELVWSEHDGTGDMLIGPQLITRLRTVSPGPAGVPGPPPPPAPPPPDGAMGPAGVPEPPPPPPAE